jgi:hypothetical protein
LGEVRALPVDEFESWRTFYKIEPWGWHDREYRTAVLLAMLRNTHVEKNSRKSIDDYIRDMPKAIEKAYFEYERELELREKFRTASREEKAKMIASSFGVKDVKIGNRRNDSR